MQNVSEYDQEILQSNIADQPRHLEEKPHNTNSHKISGSEYDQEILQSHIVGQPTAPIGKAT